MANNNLSGFIFLFWLVGILLPDLIHSNEGLRFPNYQYLKDSFKPSDAILLDRNGTKMQTNRIDFKKRQIEWWDVENISPYLVEAIIAAEDRRFFEHNGVDGLALTNAIANLFSRKSYRGGSTISMQVAGLLEPELRGIGKRRTILQKIKQINSAATLELEWTKNEILTYYINHVPMRGEMIGIPTASYAHFGVSPDNLNKFQSMVLVSIVPSPNAPLSVLKSRVLKLSGKLGWEFNHDDWVSWISGNWYDPKLTNWTINHAYHYTSSYFPKEKGFIVSGLDYQIQYKVNSILKNQILQLKSRNVNDGGVVVIDNESGQILAYSGGIPGISSEEFVDSNLALRQAGSTLKPFLYALAIDKKYITSSTILSDSPLNLNVEQGVYRPSNYDKLFHGEVTARVALASSLNIPSVRTILLTGVPEFHSILKNLGIISLRESDYYGYSLALGTADIRLVELTRAYSVLARMGSDLNNKQLLSNSTTFIITDILRDREARSMGFGIENSLSTRFFSAVKTGTSQDMRDNWCLGYNKKYTVGVWIGNLNGEPMRDVTGVTGAAPVWRDVMEYLYAKSIKNGGDASDFDLLRYIPQDIVNSHNYYYIKGTEPNQDAFYNYNLVKESIQSIYYPSHGMVFTIDPDIPPRRQKIFFQSSGSSHNFFWYLNNKKLGGSGKDYPWILKEGNYLLEMRNYENRIIDSLKFSVR